MTDPTPTDLEIAQSTVPVGIDARTQTQSNDGRAGANQIERGCRQDQPQTSQGIGITNFARLQLKTSRFIIQEVFFQVKTQAIFIKGVQIGWIVTENSPFFIAVAGLNMRQGQMNRAKLAIRNPHFVQKQSLCLWQASSDPH